VIETEVEREGKDVHQDPAGDHPSPAPDNARPTGNLIASDKESGKAIYGAENKKVGSIDHVMVDKNSGEIAYAVLSFGGFLGIGNEHYPVPWKLLTYDTGLGGYRSDISANRKARQSTALNSMTGRPDARS
jgi:hypothetical protein